MRFIFTCLLVSLVLIGSAQSPSLINYQGVARDAAGIPLANQSISVKFDILQGSATGTSIYTDTKTGISTNALGLFSTQIGQNAGLSQVNWQGGPYYLQVSMDPTGGSNFVTVGTQQIVSVPFAMHAQTVPSSYSNNVLTIGSQTHAINSGTAVTVSSSGTNITVSGGPNYTLSYTPSVPQLSLSSNNLSIVGGNAVALPVAQSPTLVPSGIATVTNGASSYTVGVPAPSYNQNSGVLSMGSATTLATPTLGLAGNILYSGPFSNSVSIPNAVTLSGLGQATVTGGPNYLVNVGLPQLALSSNNLSISIVGSNSVALPAAVTVAGSGSVVSVTGGPTNYVVNVPNPSYSGTVLTLGTSTTVIAPTLSFNNSTGVLTSGPASNSVSISNFGPFTQAGTSVSLTTISNSLALGLNAASAKLDVYSNAGGPVLKVTDASASNSSPAAVISSGGLLSLDVSNSNAGGVAGNFSSTGGYAINATNSSASFPAVYANNTNISGEAGYFNGGLRVAGNSNTSASFALKVLDNSSTNLMVVRNDGNVGIGTTAPSQRLEVNGSVKMTDGNQALGKVLTSDATGVASWQAQSVTTTSVFSNQSISSVNSTPSAFPNSLATFTKIYSDSRVQVIVQTHLYVDDLSSTFAAIYELRIGTSQPGNNTGRVPYFQDNNSGPTDFSKSMPVTIIADFPASVFSGGPGSYTINMYASGGSGSASNVYIDPGNFGTNSIIIREYR